MSWERLYLLRHGETQWNRENLFRGRSDVDLSEMGIEQARNSARALVGYGVTEILSSPVRRAMQTAEIIAETLGVQVTEAAPLSDPDVGEWMGKSMTLVKESHPHDFRTMNERTSSFRFPGGESVKEVADRSYSFLFHEMDDREGRILAVTHNFVCQVIVLSFLKADLDNLFSVHHDHCALSTLQRKGDKVVLRAWNERIRA